MAGLFAAGDSWWLRATAFWGEPVPALLVGLACCLLLPVPDKRNAFATHGMAGKALADSATIILITGAGGIFGKMLQQAHLADMLGQSLLQSNLGIFLPFVLAAILKSAQGSSTVAMITVASVMAPLMPALGYQSEIDKALLVCAIAAGSLVVSHVNDSYFWVVTQLSDMDVKTGYRLHTMGTLIIGVAAMVAVSILFFILH
jgi:GntP family gluconate:H+ symporter